VFQIIFGDDFNCPGINWKHGTLTYLCAVQLLGENDYTITRYSDVPNSYLPKII